MFVVVVVVVVVVVFVVFVVVAVVAARGVFVVLSPLSFPTELMWRGARR